MNAGFMGPPPAVQPASGATANRLPRSVARVSLAVLGLLFLFKGAAVVVGWPATFIDEIAILEPAVRWARGEGFTLPCIATQMRIPGQSKTLADHAFDYPPMYAWAHLPAQLILGNSIYARRLTDLLILATLAAAFLATARHFCRVPVLPLFATACLLAGPTPWWASPGRPDPLGCALGLLALLAASRAGKGHLAGNAMLAGFLCGASTLCHPFSGMFWSAATGLVLWQGLPLSRGVAAMAWAVAGGIAGLALWLPVILQDPSFWWTHWRWRVNAKLTWLCIEPLTAVQVTLPMVVGWNPWFLLAAAGVGVGWRRGPRRSLRLAFVILALLAFVYRIFSFEYYTSHYAVHFRALLMLVAALAISDRWEIRPLPRWVTLPHFAGLAAAVVLLPPLFRYGLKPSIGVFALPNTTKYAEVGSLLRATVRPSDRVLVHGRLYLETPSERKVLMFFHERLSLEDFDVVITDARLTVAEHMDQWVDALTPLQASVLQGSFEPMGRVDPASAGFRLASRDFAESTVSAVVWRRQGTDSSAVQADPRGAARSSR